jgi:hypothetical protein
VLGGLVCLDLALLEPESDLLLGILDAVGAVADIAADIDSVVTADGTWLGSEGVGCTEEDCHILVEVDGMLEVGRGQDLPRPVLTASRPSQTIAQIGPLPMSSNC